jgi:periplasmic protein TonB
MENIGVRVVRTSDGSPQFEFRPGPLALPAQGTTELSSADDINPLIASPPASSSEPQPEESPIELEEVEAAESRPKPTVRTNMVAQEVRVKAAGARPGKSAGERELFTEETTSVLVGENGGVIRLSAAVAPGQLLILTNEESKREVVAQVKRKRTYKPTNCYVELEFAEPAQRFWGREFSAATALLPKDAQEAEAAALVISAEATADEPSEPPTAPTLEEVQALKREVETLRKQLKLTQTPAASEQAPARVPAAVPVASLAPTVGDVRSAGSNSNSGSDDASGVAFIAQSPPLEHHPLPPQLTAAEQVLLPKPALDFTMPRPKAKRSLRARGRFTPGFRAGALRLALLTTTLVITAVGAAWYKHWIRWNSGANKPSASVPTSVVNTKTSTLPDSQEAAKVHSESSNTRVVSEAPATSRGTPSRSAVQPNTPAPEVTDAGEPSTQPSTSSESVAQPAVKRAPPPKTLAEKRSTVPRTPKTASDSAAPSAVEGVIVPPKLIKSVRAVATMDAVRDFETGSVVIDTVVGTEGKVESMNVLSGPPSLHDAAMQALKQYRYEPATRNGQPVPAHVTVTIRFRFEP